MKLNIWIEWEGESSLSEGYFTQAVGREPAPSPGILGPGAREQEQDDVPANLPLPQRSSL